MTAEEIIKRLRKEIDRMYQDYEGTPMIEEDYPWEIIDYDD